jgi:hypothetical protein
MNKLASIITAIVLTLTPAYADTPIPELDFKVYCSKHTLGAEFCLSMEAWHHESLVKLWPQLSEKDKAYCQAGVKSYGELLSCAKIKAER